MQPSSGTCQRYFRGSTSLALAILATILSARTALAQGTQPLADARDRMVDEEIVAAGVTHPRVVRSLRDTPRHQFVSVAQRKYAYFDMALPIGHGQTISPPFVVAYMTEQLAPRTDDKVLEVGTGSGYQAAVLSPLVAEVYSIEIVPALGRRAARTLKRLGYDNVHTKVGDGYQGWAEHAPFDKIIVTCSPEKVPGALVEQLAEGGRLIVPLGERYQQTLYLFQKRDGRLVQSELLPTLFVPMTGTAEERRRIQPDPSRPEIFNGGFEEIAGETGKPTGWHYVRQAEVVEAENAPAGRRYLKFTNQQAGRGCQALQGMAVDGRQVTGLDVSLRVRAADVRRGSTADQWPMLVVTFYDTRRATVGRRTLGPWRGSFAWRTEHARITVPPQAREAIIHIGLLGATGELALDEVQLHVIER